MKIVLVENSAALADGRMAPHVVVGADSALLRMSEPVFLPDGTMAWSAMIVPALRIGRLGLHIPRAAALGYIDGHTLFHLLVPAAGIADKALWALSDRTFSPGRWLAGAFDETADTSCTIETEDIYGTAAGRKEEMPLRVTAAQCADMVAAISRYSTLKTGDVLLAGDAAYRMPLKPDMRLRAKINEDKILEIKIK